MPGVYSIGPSIKVTSHGGGGDLLKEERKGKRKNVGEED